MGKNGMRSTWTLKLGQNFISIEKEGKNLGAIIQDNLSSDKYYIDKNIWWHIHDAKKYIDGFSLPR